MRAVGVITPVSVGGTADALQDLDLPRPSPGTNEVLVRVVASSINIDDIHVVEGTMFGGLPVGPRVSAGEAIVPGTDVAGVVVAVGEKVGDFVPGDAVFGTHSPTRALGGWADYCCVQQNRLQPKPAQWSFEAAAACGLGGMVAVAALEALRWHQRGRYVVIGASGGIGSLITQALAAKGSEVYGVCGPANVGLIRSFGVTPIDYTNQDFGTVLSGLDGVVDCVGGLETERAAFQVLRREGVFVTLAGPEKYIGERKLAWWRLLGIFWHMARRSMLGRLRGPGYVVVSPVARHAALIAPWLADAGVTPLVGRTIPLDAAMLANGVRLVVSHRARGKVVVSISGTSEAA